MESNWELGEKNGDVLSKLVAVGVWNIYLKLTLSLDENLLYRGSSFITFLTSFHEENSVHSDVSFRSSLVENNFYKYTTHYFTTFKGKKLVNIYDFIPSFAAFFMDEWIS